jgi:hypothetical protein
MDETIEFFESCYNPKRKTLNFPIEWIQYFNKIGGDNFIGLLNEWIEENRIPLPDIGHTLDDALVDFFKLGALGGTPSFNPPGKVEHNVNYYYNDENQMEDKNTSMIEDSIPWTHFLDYSTPRITFPLSRFPYFSKSKETKEIKQYNQSKTNSIGGLKGGVAPLIRISLAGNACAHYFNTPYRMKTRGLKSKSVAEIWIDKPFRHRALNMLRTKARYNRSINSAAFLNILMNKGCSATNFKPSVAKTIYQVFNAKKIYDFSTGWGDRLIAAMATPGVRLYVGTDPNTDNHSLYTKILKTLDEPSSEMVENRTEVALHFEKAEDFHPAEIYGNDFDLVFTSCPYFNLEKYGAGTQDEDDQCWKKYPEVDQWLQKFLFSALTNALNCLKPGGVLAINIADFLKADKRTSLCEPMNKFLLSTKLVDYCGCIGMKLHKRYGNYIKDKDGVHAEPIWIWRKK